MLDRGRTPESSDCRPLPLALPERETPPADPGAAAAAAAGGAVPDSQKHSTLVASVSSEPGHISRSGKFRQNLHDDGRMMAGLAGWWQFWQVGGRMMAE
jgi:hypothetical protein